MHKEIQLIEGTLPVQCTNYPVKPNQAEPTFLHFTCYGIAQVNIVIHKSCLKVSHVFSEMMTKAYYKGETAGIEKGKKLKVNEFKSLLNIETND